MLKVGLTGSIGTGKSTVLKLFNQLGAYTVDVDKIVHQLYKRKDIQEKVKKEFGDVFNEDGSLNRKKVAKIIFNNPEKKKVLENIIHPEVRKEVKRFIQNIEKKNKKAIVIVEVPLLIETGQY
ncbi:MAG: dephospho-CoA kinase, partial [Persephonella sp.]